MKTSPSKSQLGGATNRTMTQQQSADFNYEGAANQDDGVGGSGEELAQTLEKVVSQLDIISRTLDVLQQRVSMNEESVSTVMNYFAELRAQKENHMGQQIHNTNLGFSQSTGHVINAHAQRSDRNIPQSSASMTPDGLGVTGHLSFNQNALNQQLYQQL